MHIKRKLINAPTSSARLSVSYLPVSHSQVNNSIQKESQLNVKHRLLCQHSGGIKQNWCSSVRPFHSPVLKKSDFRATVNTGY